MGMGWGTFQWGSGGWGIGTPDGTPILIAGASANSTVGFAIPTTYPKLQFGSIRSCNTINLDAARSYPTIDLSLASSYPTVSIESVTSYD